MIEDFTNLNVQRISKCPVHVASILHLVSLLEWTFSRLLGVIPPVIIIGSCLLSLEFIWVCFEKGRCLNWYLMLWAELMQMIPGKFKVQRAFFANLYCCYRNELLLVLWWCWHLYSVSWGCHYKVLWTGWLKRTEIFNLTRFWRLQSEIRCWHSHIPAKLLRKDLSSSTF